MNQNVDIGASRINKTQTINERQGKKVKKKKKKKLVHNQRSQRKKRKIAPNECYLFWTGDERDNSDVFFDEDIKREKKTALKTLTATLFGQTETNLSNKYRTRIFIRSLIFFSLLVQCRANGVFYFYLVICCFFFVSSIVSSLHTSSKVNVRRSFRFPMTIKTVSTSKTPFSFTLPLKRSTSELRKVTPKWMCANFFFSSLKISK